MTELDLFVITSVINTGSHPWSYASKRSVFTAEERFQQTLESIGSIRRQHGNAKILLVECSNLTDKMTSTLRSQVEYFLNVVDDEPTRLACLESNKKGSGETLQLLYVLDFIEKNNITFQRLFKLSGRYYLNSCFNKEDFSTTHVSFNTCFKGTTNHCLILYSVPYCLLDVYEIALHQCAEIYKSTSISLEDILPPRCMPQTYVECIGVSGYNAVVENEFFSVDQDRRYY
jgi:hypothetical protein